MAREISMSKKITAPSKKINPFSKENILRVKIPLPDGSYLSAGDFIERIKTDPGFYDEQTLVARAVLFKVCKTGNQTNAQAARSILKYAGYTKETIPKEAYAKRRTPDQILLSFQRFPKDFLIMMESDIEQMKSLFRHRLKQTKVEEDIKEVFKNLYERDMTQEEIEKVRKRIGPLVKNPWSFPELAVLFLSFEINFKRQTHGGKPISFYLLKKLIFKARREARLESLNDTWGITEQARRALDKKYKQKLERLGFITLKKSIIKANKK